MAIQVGQTPLVLASTSPRRREMLERLGIPFQVRAPEVDEEARPGEAPRAYVERVARAKADAVQGEWVLAADTAVVLGDRILGKPRDAADAKAILSSLSGREHRVLTAVALGGRAREACTVETAVVFRELSTRAIDWYVATGEPLDKAGAYAIQGAGGAFVARIEGSASNVVGLPLVETLALLERAGLAFACT